MNFKNTEIKIDQIVSYLNDNKINLSPVFQRGHVWTITQRKKLLKNILLGRPIPAVFLFKKGDGSKYLYNILDGKQRLESIILFIASKRNDLSIKNWDNYLFGAVRKQANFPAEYNTSKKAPFYRLPDDIVRDFREYTIPTVEITLDDETGVDEVISLFVDINQQGVPVSRFDIVKAMCRESKTLKKAFDLIAIEQKRKNDVFYHMKGSSISKVLKQLSIVQSTQDQKNKVDKIWQKLIEIILFTVNFEHAKPSEILKGFISKKDKILSANITAANIRKIQSAFTFLWKLYGKKNMATSPIFLDQTHSYTAITSIIKHDLVNKFGEKVLMNKIDQFSRQLGKASIPSLAKKIRKYQSSSQSHTTDPSNRKDREALFVEIIDSI